MDQNAGNSQSWVSHKWVTSQSLVTFGGANRAPVGHEGVIFFNHTLGSPSGELIQHVWTLLGSKKQFENLANSAQNPLTRWTERRNQTRYWRWSRMERIPIRRRSAHGMSRHLFFYPLAYRLLLPFLFFPNYAQPALWLLNALSL